MHDASRLFETEDPPCLMWIALMSGNYGRWQVAPFAELHNPPSILVVIRNCVAR